MPSTIFNIKLIVTDEVDMQDDEEAAYEWAIEASLEDARLRDATRSRRRVKAATTVDLRRIPGVVDVPNGTTRGPSLLGAATGDCSSPAKAEGPEADASCKRRRGEVVATTAAIEIWQSKCKSITSQTQLSKRRCFDDLAIDKLRLVTGNGKRVLVNLDDLQLDRKRLRLSELSVLGLSPRRATDAPT